MGADTRTRRHRVRTNLNALRQLLQHRQHGKIRSAEDVIDAAEAYATRTPDPDRRAALLSATRLLRRIDQAAVKLATDLGHPDQATQPQTGHGLWTAILGGALFAAAARYGRPRLTAAVLGWYALAVLLHALWDASRGIAVWLTLHLTATPRCSGC